MGDGLSQQPYRPLVEKSHTLGGTCRAQGQQLCGHSLDGLVPGDGSPLALSSFPDSLERRLHPVGVVQQVQTDLALGAGSALVTGVLVVAPDLDGYVSHDPYPKAALGRAQLANAGHPPLFTGRGFLINHVQCGQDGTARLVEGCCGGAHPSQFEKGSSADLHYGLIHSVLRYPAFWMSLLKGVILGQFFFPDGVVGRPSVASAEDELCILQRVQMVGYR